MLAKEMRLTLAAALFVIGLACLPGEACADVQTVNVVSVGGQGSNLFILFSGNVGTDQGCLGKRLIVTSTVLDAAAEGRLYAAMLVAYATGSQVTLSVSSCYGSYPALSATDWWFVPQEG
jgi:hypothetical protein